MIYDVMQLMFMRTRQVGISRMVAIFNMIQCDHRASLGSFLSSTYFSTVYCMQSWYSPAANKLTQWPYTNTQRLYQRAELLQQRFRTFPNSYSKSDMIFKDIPPNAPMKGYHCDYEFVTYLPQACSHVVCMANSPSCHKFMSNVITPLHANVESKASMSPYSYVITIMSQAYHTHQHQAINYLKFERLLDFKKFT